MNAKSLKRLFSYLKGASGLVVLSVIIGLLFGGATVAIPYFAGRAIDDLGNTDELIKCIFIIAGLIVVAALLQFALIKMNNRIAYAIGQNLRNATYSKMHRVKMSYIDKTSAGKLQSFIIPEPVCFRNCHYHHHSDRHVPYQLEDIAYRRYIYTCVDCSIDSYRKRCL